MSAPPFAASLRWHRQQVGLTLTALARESGVDLSHLSRCEGGKVHRPGEGTLRSLADALGVPAGRLLEPPPAPERAADDLAPVDPAAKSCLCVPPAPVAAGQGDRPPAESVLEAARLAGPDVPGAAAVGESRSQLLGRTWVVMLPAGLEPLSLNQRLHWAEQRKRAAELKKAAWAVALNGKIPHLDSVRVTVVYHPPDRRRRDHDNTPALMGKHAIDGIVASGVLSDDCPPNITGISYAIGEVVKGGQLVLHLTEVTA